MARKRKTGFGLAAAGVAGLMTAVPAGQAAAADRLKHRDDGCPEAAAIQIPNLLDARKSGNESTAEKKGKRGPLRKRTTKKAARKKATKKTVKKAATKTVKRAATRSPAGKRSHKIRKKAPRSAGRNPC